MNTYTNMMVMELFFLITVTFSFASSEPSCLVVIGRPAIDHWYTRYDQYYTSYNRQIWHNYSISVILGHQHIPLPVAITNRFVE